MNDPSRCPWPTPYPGLLKDESGESIWNTSTPPTTQGLPKTTSRSTNLIWVSTLSPMELQKQGDLSLSENIAQVHGQQRWRWGPFSLYKGTLATLPHWMLRYIYKTGNIISLLISLLTEGTKTEGLTWPAQGPMLLLFFYFLLKKPTLLVGGAKTWTLLFWLRILCAFHSMAEHLKISQLLTGSICNCQMSSIYVRYVKSSIYIYMSKAHP